MTTAPDGRRLPDVLVAAPSRVIAVTPDDDADLPTGVACGILVTVEGNLEFRAAGATEGSVTIPVVAGQRVDIQVKRVLENTTATVFALYP